MQWQDEGLIASLKPYGESSMVVHIFTQNHGLWAGIMRGAHRSVGRVMLQPGMRVTASWKARLENQLGFWALESHVWPGFSYILAARLPLLALMNLCAFIKRGIPERHPFPTLYVVCRTFMDQLAAAASAPSKVILWPWSYASLEREFLRELGYGLDLDACAVTGVTQGLSHVSPVTGRAVCAQVAAPYQGKLLLLPDFFKDSPEMLSKPGLESGSVEELQAAFRLTGHFLAKHVFCKQSGGLPGTREQMIHVLLPHLQNISGAVGIKDIRSASR